MKRSLPLLPPPSKKSLSSISSAPPVSPLTFGKSSTAISSSWIPTSPPMPSPSSPSSPHHNHRRTYRSDKRNDYVQSDQQAFYYLEKAVDQLHPGALYLLGAVYLTGDCVKKDVASALWCFHRASEKGHAGAAIAYGSLILRGIKIGHLVLDLDEYENLKWWRTWVCVDGAPLRVRHHPCYGLSLLEYPGLKAIDPAYAVPVDVSEAHPDTVQFDEQRRKVRREKHRGVGQEDKGHRESCNKKKEEKDLKFW
ncbi:hypothetical protein TEA_024519 [Camellia sinensis var. sinensis]|uniref:Uncharacterized protein n=1 Tax=Camellia sinensis var. sinensis TaxID=542762 RepID=A0A4S4D195_CAMSN|nr:hypothetical protein TEA_024519 [Camellia sinensis var. sinensis]